MELWAREIAYEFGGREAGKGIREGSSARGFLMGDFYFIRPGMLDANQLNEASASRAWSQHCRKWPFLGGGCKPRTSFYGNVDITL